MSMRDFSNYELADFDPLSIAGGVLPEIANAAGVQLDPNDMISSLGALVGAIGPSKFLQENIELVRETIGADGDEYSIAAEWLGRSGVMKQLDRSLWTPDISTPDDVPAIILSGAVANWQDRTYNLLVKRVAEGKPAGRVYIPVGDATMDSPTEVNNANVQALTEARRGVAPTQTDYANEVGQPLLEAAGYRVEVIPYPGLNGDQIAEQFVAERPGFFEWGDSRIAFARVANAGVMLATQFRQAAHAKGMNFDKDPDNPQLFVITDEFPIAQDAVEAKKSKEFQNPLTALRMVAVTAKHLQVAKESR